VAECAGCRAFLERYAALAKTIRSFAAPSSELAKIAFVDSLGEAGPIIRSLPGTTAAGFSFKAFFRSASKPLMGTAAAVAVGLGLWAASGPRRSVAEAPAPRHELLKKVVASNAALAATSDPKARIATLSDLAGELRGESRDLHKAADAGDLEALAALYEKVVRDGLVPQAKQLNPMAVGAEERHRILNAAADKLAATADDAGILARDAPEHAKAPLLRIRKAAAKGREDLIQIANGGA
jgi:hypothetical protein